MKTSLFSISLVFVFFGVLASFATNSSRGELKSLVEVEKKWGSQSFDSKKFKLGNISDRASMAADLIKKKKFYVGKPTSEIREELGEFSGHYVSERFPTYLIHLGTSDSRETWQLVFLLDNDSKVSDVVVHKNCCYPIAKK
jgi:hypothetical protein